MLTTQVIVERSDTEKITEWLMTIFNPEAKKQSLLTFLSNLLTSDRQTGPWGTVPASRTRTRPGSGPP